MALPAVNRWQILTPPVGDRDGLSGPGWALYSQVVRGLGKHLAT